MQKHRNAKSHTKRSRQGSAAFRPPEALVAALAKAGVEFIPENGGGAGVLLAKRVSEPNGRSALLDSTKA